MSQAIPQHQQNSDKDEHALLARGQPTIYTIPSVPQNLSTRAMAKPPAPEASYR